MREVWYTGMGFSDNVNIGRVFHQLAQVVEQFPGLAVMIFR